MIRIAAKMIDIASPIGSQPWWKTARPHFVPSCQNQIGAMLKFHRMNQIGLNLLDHLSERLGTVKGITLRPGIAKPIPGLELNHLCRLEPG